MEDQRRSMCVRLNEVDDADKFETRHQGGVDPGEQDEDFEQPVQSILNNQLVFEHIASFLPFGDLKAASEVSRNFFEVIRGTVRFRKKAVLAITNDAPEMKSTMTYNWRNLKVDLKNPILNLEVLKGVLKTADFVCLGAHKIEEPSPRQEINSNAAALLTQVLITASKLTTLQIDIAFLYANLSEVFSIPAVQDALRKLHQLEIVDMQAMEQSKYDGPGDIPRLVHTQRLLTLDENGPFARNFDLLTQHLTGIKSLKMVRVTPSSAEGTGSLQQSVLRLIQNNRDTLEELSVHGVVWRMQELRRFVLPLLKSLTVEVDGPKQPEEDTFALFLKSNGASLQELDLVFWPYREALTSAIRGCSGSLKKLGLRMVPGFNTFDWSLIGSMTKLKDLVITVGSYLVGVGTGPRLLASLPKNQLDKLYLQCVVGCFYGGFWTVNGIETPLEEKFNHLRGFSCLKSLRIFDCGDLVDNVVLQFILTEFKALEELELNRCPLLTDAGMRSDDVSLADLRGLKVLAISECSGVTPAGVLSYVALPFLQKLEYLSSEPVESSWVLALGRQNPSLVSMKVKDCGGIKHLEATLLRENRRLQQLVGMP